MPRPRYTARAVLLAALLLAGCDNTVAPIAEDAPFFFAIYGYLDTRADTQFVRVSALRRTAEDPSGLPGVEVASTHLETGARTVWRDSLVRLDDGGTGHLFYAPFRAEPGGRYRLDVQRAGAPTTRALTTVPAGTPLHVEPPVVDTLGRYTQVVTLTGLTSRPFEADVQYRVRPPKSDRPLPVTISYENRLGLRTAAGWAITVRLSQDRFAVLQRLGLPREDSTVALVDLSLQLALLSPEWDQPEAPANIENGTGFFASIGHHTASWSLDSTAAVRTGFAPP